MLTSATKIMTLTVVALQLTMVGLVLAGAVQQDNLAANNLAIFDSVALKIISEDDQANMKHIKQQIEDDFAKFKTINEVHSFLDRVKTLVQKHPKNVAFAQDDLKELHKFLSQEDVTRLIRVDTEPFIMPISDDRMPMAQRAVDEDELTRKLFGGPLRSLVEAKKQQVSHHSDGNHKDGNFFSNFWCKISGGCSN